MNEKSNVTDRVPELMREAEEISEVVNEWSEKISNVENEDQAQQLRDLMAKITGRLAQVEADREAEKRPYLEAGRAVDARYAPLKSLLEACARPVQELLVGWLKLERDRQQADVVAARTEAARLAAVAEAARKAVEAKRTVVSTTAAVDAERRAKEAAEAVETALRAKPQVASASGGVRKAALRTTWYAVCTSVPLAFRTYGHHPDVIEVLERLASASAKTHKGNVAISGFEIRSKETVV